MEIFTPRIGDTIRIGDGIEVTVISIKDGQVRFNFQVPAGVRVHPENGQPNLQVVYRNTHPVPSDRAKAIH